MYQVHQDLQRRFYKEQCKEGEEGADKKSVGRTISLNGQGCDAVREAEDKIKWREKVATSVALQRSLTTGQVQVQVQVSWFVISTLLYIF